MTFTMEVSRSKVISDGYTCVTLDILKSVSLRWLVKVINIPDLYYGWKQVEVIKARALKAADLECGVKIKGH